MNKELPELPLCPTRRDFLSTTTKLSAVLTAAPYVSRAQALLANADTLNAAVIGWGQQGSVLAKAALKIPGVRFKAVCDISPTKRQHGSRLLKIYQHDAPAFENYAEMLATVPDLDAVIVATPDFMHAEHTNAALRAGKHVYCEKLMSNTIEGARSMVQTARATRKLLQIGHQRRSNPCYLHAREKILREARLLGRITTVSGEWHRSVADDLGAPKQGELSPEKLAQYGYGSMHEFLNWRWFKKYGGGPISDLGAHQIDVFNWMLNANPRSIVADGGIDYYAKHEWYDNAVAIYEYATTEGVVRATYDVLTTTSAGGGYHEYFMGDEGALKISENPKLTRIYRETRAPLWDEFVRRQLIAEVEDGDGARGALKPWEKPRPKMPVARKLAATSAEVEAVDVRASIPLSVWVLPITVTAIHQPHLENFFDAIRRGTPLNCPAEAAFASAVTVLGVNQAIAAARKLAFAPADFVA